MNVLILYYKHIAVNYNKMLIIDTLKINSNIFNNNNISIEIISRVGNSSIICDSQTDTKETSEFGTSFDRSKIQIFRVRIDFF